MRITRKEIGKISGIFLSVLEREGIKENIDIRRHIGESVFTELMTDYITFTQRKSGGNSSAFAVCYIRIGAGIPINLSVNEERRYSIVVVKSDETLPGFQHYSQDSFGNFLQGKRIDAYNISDLKRELEELQR